MPVDVHLVNGTTKTYAQADAAYHDGSLFRVSKWNSKRRKSEDLEVLQAHDVIFAEIFRSGVLQRIEFGAGKRQS